jgi:ubiquinone/menaquinone biosynthesis C-methylase UbiE
VTDWGLAHIPIEKHFTILDVGCGGGRTVSKLAVIASQGKVYGIDHSEDAVAASKKMNARWISLGRVEIRHGSVSHLPYADGMFDLVVAVETHFWWPDLSGDIREVFRVIKPGGELILIAEVYKGAKTRASKMLEKYGPEMGMALLSPEEHRQLLANAGLAESQVEVEPEKGWICATGRKPGA